MLKTLGGLYGQTCRWLDYAQPVVALVARLYVARVFFLSGMTKIASWTSTLELFEYEYHVPVLSPTMAAYLSSAAELCLPILLVTGLLTRCGAVGLFVLNAVAVISYPEMGPVGMKDHYLWGTILAFILFYGPGKLSLDHFLCWKFGNRAMQPATA